MNASLACAAAALAVVSLGVPTASASDTVIIDEREFGPEEGLSVVTESFEVVAGKEFVGSEYEEASNPDLITPQDSWGTSYAYSNEYAYVTYRGVGKAAGNVYAGRRIIKVCFWWTRGGSSVTGKTCSSATSSGSRWSAGKEVIGWATDSLDPNAPSTIFHIQTTRISPNIF